MAETHFATGPLKAAGRYVFKGSDCIGMFDTDNQNDRKMAANASLFAAAPDLYAALEEALANSNVDMDVFERGQTALAKARSETND